MNFNPEMPPEFEEHKRKVNEEYAKISKCAEKERMRQHYKDLWLSLIDITCKLTCKVCLIVVIVHFIVKFW